MCILTLTAEPERISGTEDAITGLIDFLLPSLVILWKEWPVDFVAVTLPPPMGLFSFRGTCPHANCRADAGFNIVPMNLGGGQHPAIHMASKPDPTFVTWAIMQCQACLGYILGCATQRGPDTWQYVRHYPIGQPHDTVSPHVPAEIAFDFKQAIRCRGVKAFGATVLMCRRSLQVSCDMENADGKDLFKQIDDLASKQRITEPLKKMAHRIRLLGKQGAHGDYSDIDATITEKDADDAILFMAHYVEHVYVLPKQLE
jgi:hypothetical protein